jgi:serine/threonine-protein kinase
MQYVEGEDLSQYLRRNKKLHPRDAAKIICQVADALMWASTRGVVHRDLKPSNLYLDNSGRVMVLDFGIAKATDVPSLLTAATERLGTTYYMSPEQIRGEACDVRSDLYSLGVVFFELLSGRKPFEGDSYRAIEMGHIEQPPPDLAQLDATIPPELCEIVKTLLQKSPAQRYQRAEDLITDLNRFGAGQTPLGIRPNATASAIGEQTIPSHGAQGVPQTSSGSFRPTTTPPAPVSPAPSQKPKSNVFVLSAIVVLALLVGAAGYLYWQKTSGERQTKPTATAQQSAPLPKERLDKLGHRMVLVPAGNFIFGDDTDPLSPNGKEVANLDSFYVDETEVSNGMYKMFCEATNRKTPNSPNFDSNPDLPVTNVSYEDAEAFAKWMGKRLPSEKEWEKAARGTDGRIYPWGNAPWKNTPHDLQKVDSYPERRSPYGAYNMAGNAAEWTTGHFPAGPREKDDMKQALGTSHFSDDWKVIKGGYFGSMHPDQEWRCYMRRGFPKDVSASDKISFRCVTDAK